MGTRAHALPDELHGGKGRAMRVKHRELSAGDDAVAHGVPNLIDSSDVPALGK